MTVGIKKSLTSMPIKYNVNGSFYKFRSLLCINQSRYRYRTKGKVQKKSTADWRETAVYCETYKNTIEKI